MYPFGLFIILVVFFVFVKKKNFKEIYVSLLAITISVESFVNVGYFLRFGSYEFTYSEFLLLLLGVLSIIIIIKQPLNKGLVFFGFLLGFVVIISNAMLIINPIDKPIVTYGMGWGTGESTNAQFTFQSIKMTLRILLFILIAIAAISVIKKKDINILKKYFIGTGNIVIILVLIEFIIKNIFKSSFYNTAVNWIFGIGNSTITDLLVRDGIFSLQGLTREPSQLSIGIFYYSFVIILSKETNRKNNIFLIIAIIELLLSRALMGVVLAICIIAIYAVINKKKIFAFIIMACTFPFIFFSEYFSYYLNRIINSLMLFKDVTQVDYTISEHVRLISVLENFDLLVSRPFFGIGVGTSYAFGFLPTIISNVGLIGFFVWNILIFFVIAKMKINFDNFLIMIVMYMSWVTAGGLSTMYSMAILLLAILFRGKVLNEKNSIQLNENFRVEQSF
ncbi:hypothetical protein ACOQFO_02170 [Ureibacillus sp. MALMAid1270]|uniref:hypothetical protein n=1 Tax=Ureibacillus sp. MALMAid1270 TaxID=3411629 RepID=UPI003BA481FC